MQRLDLTPSPNTLEPQGFCECDQEVEQLFIIELKVPVAAKVPPPQQLAEVALPVVLQASVTSTVPPTLLTELRVNNTAMHSAWRITATLAVPRARQSARF